jgi:hypothetical protein
VEVPVYRRPDQVAIAAEPPVVKAAASTLAYRLGRDVLLGRITSDVALALALGRCDGPNGRPVYGQPGGRPYPRSKPTVEPLPSR